MLRDGAARIMSLTDPTRKMSKSEHSDKGCIYLLDDPAKAKKKIMGAVTDSFGEIKADKVNQPGLYNLMEIAASLNGSTPEKIAEEFAGKGYGELKRYVGDAVATTLEGIQARYRDILANNVIDEVLKQGAEKATLIAAKKLDEVTKKIGLEIR